MAYVSLQETGVALWMEKTQSAAISKEFAQKRTKKKQEHQIREAWLTFFWLVQRCAQYN